MQIRAFGEALPTFDLRGMTHLSRPVMRSFVDTQGDDVGGLTRSGMGGGEEIVHSSPLAPQV